MQKKHFAWLSGFLLIAWVGQAILLAHSISSTGITTLAQGKILFLILELVGIILMLMGALKKPSRKK